MQPCPVCGNTGVDANGYCTTCSTYLGVPQQGGYPAQSGYPAQPGYPQEPQYGAAYPGQPVNPTSGPAATTPYPAYPPSSSVPYSSAPASAPGYGQPSAPPNYTPGYAGGQASAPPAGYGPASAPPAGYGPASAPPGFSGPGYGYPTGAPEPPKKSYTGAIVAASVGLVVLVAAIVVVVVVKNHKSTPTAGPTNRPSATASAKPTASSGVNAKGIDTCVVGDWKVTSEQLSDDFPGYDDVPLTLKGGYKITLNADGTAKEDYEAYGDETDYYATYNGHTFQLAFDGTLTYNFTAKNGTLSATESITDGRFGKWQDGDSVDSGTNQFDDYDWSYTCSGDVMTRTLSNDTQRLTRL